MKTALFLSAFTLAAAVPLHAVMAAHAGAPHSHVNHQNDAGNDTGDARVDELNAQQLSQIQMQGQQQMPGQPMPGQPMPGARMGMPARQ